MLKIDEFEKQIQARDINLFKWIESQTSNTDRKALLDLQNIIRETKANYTYLEIGSHLGGTLQPYVIDKNCTKIFSIDPRPLEQADERWKKSYKYPENSTFRMIEHLKKIPNSDVQKVSSIEKYAVEILKEEIDLPADFVFIDGEHTNKAVYSDFVSCLDWVNDTSIIAFHDCFVVSKGIKECLNLLSSKNVSVLVYYYLRSNIIAFVLNPSVYIIEQFQNDVNWMNSLPNYKFFIHHMKNKIKRIFNV